jgi:uncharacterized protein YbjT (DUF2867 family)
MRILVTGATGYVGSRLVTALLADQHQVIASSRNPERLKLFGWFDQVVPVRLDASDPESTRDAFATAAEAAGGPVDLVYYLVHAIGQRDFRDADNAAAANVATAAGDAGVHRIVYLGGFVPNDRTLSEHLASRAEVAQALSVVGGPELVWLGAAIIIGAGSTSFEMLRYVADRFPVIPTPPRLDNPIDPISIRDVLHYLVAAADPAQVPAGAYDIHGPDTTSYRRLLKTYARVAGKRQVIFRVPGFHTAVTARVLAYTLPVPFGLAGDLVDSLDHPMVASVSGLRDRVPDPPGGLLGARQAIALALAGRSNPARPVNALADPHDLADTDPEWAGGDARRVRRFARTLAGAAHTRRNTLVALTAKALQA